MERIIDKITMREAEFMAEHGKFPTHLIIGSDYSILMYEIGMEMEMDEGDALSFETSKWRNMWISVVNSSKYNDFMLA